MSATYQAALTIVNPTMPCYYSFFRLARFTKFHQLFLSIFLKALGVRGSGRHWEPDFAREEAEGRQRGHILPKVTK